MSEFYFGTPDLPEKEGQYIVRGHVCNGSVHSQPKFVAEFYVDKENYEKQDFLDSKTLYISFRESVKRFKKETDEEFDNRVQKKWSYSQHYNFYYDKDGFWNEYSPVKVNQCN